MSGGKRIRTADPLHAMQVLYQLSYTPVSEYNCNTTGKKVSSRNGAFLWVFLLFLWTTTGCAYLSEKDQNQELEKLGQRLDKPPFKPEPMEARRSAPKVIHSFSTRDKYGRTRKQIYLSQALPQTQHVLQWIASEDILWVYTQDQLQARCNQKNLILPDLSELKHTYETTQYICHFAYFPD